MSKICPLFSGSEGNSTLISSGGINILIDAGVSYKKLKAELEKKGVLPETLSAIFITHEHTDHINCLKTLLKNIKIPVYASGVTLNALEQINVIPEGTKVFCADEESFTYNDICVSRFATSHDCEGSSGYVFTAGDGLKAAVCTDLGVMTENVRQALSGCDTVLIESNHDITMLKNGPYPPSLKMRILSDEGHLSNSSCASELPFLLENGTKKIILGHLSRHNNTPLLALSSARASLLEIGAVENKDYLLWAAKPFDNGVISF